MRVQTLSCFALFFPGDHIWHIEGIPYFWLNGWLWIVDIKMWCWRRLSRVTWMARSNQSILKEINSEYSLERLMLKWKLQYFGHLMQRAGSLEKTLMLGKIESRRRRGWQRMRQFAGHHRLNGHECEQTPGDSERYGLLQSRGCKELVGHDLATKQVNIYGINGCPKKAFLFDTDRSEKKTSDMSLWSSTTSSQPPLPH